MKIEDAMATGNYVLGVFLDIRQAFDAVSFTVIREALLEANIPSTISKSIYFMISNRHITLTYCNCHKIGHKRQPTRRSYFSTIVESNN